MDETGPAKILTDREVKAVARALRQALGDITKKMKVEETVRFLAVSHCCRHARQQRGLTIKKAAARLKVPQYRLKAIEQGDCKSIQPDVLRAYIDLLELHVWFDRWAAANPRLAARLTAKA